MVNTLYFVIPRFCLYDEPSLKRFKLTDVQNNFIHKRTGFFATGPLCLSNWLERVVTGSP